MKMDEATSSLLKSPRITRMFTNNGASYRWLVFPRMNTDLHGWYNKGVYNWWSLQEWERPAGWSEAVCGYRNYTNFTDEGCMVACHSDRGSRSLP